MFHGVPCKKSCNNLENACHQKEILEDIQEFIKEDNAFMKKVSANPSVRARVLQAGTTVGDGV